MEFHGFETADFDVELEDVQVRKVKKFDRVWSATPGGSIVRTTLFDGILYWGAFDGYLYALDIDDRKIIWKKKLGILLDSSPVYSNRRLYIGGNREGDFYCIDADNSEIIWKCKLGGATAGYAAVKDGMVYTSCRDSYFYAIDAKTGKIIWRFKTGDEMCCAPGFSDDKIIFGSFDGYAYCLNMEGEEIWRFKTGAEVFCPVHLTVKDNIVYIPSFDSYLYAIETGSGKLLWKERLGNYGVAISPTIHEDRMYVGARDGNLFCLDIEGKILWKFKTGKVIESKATIIEGKIYFGSEDGNVYCLSKNGKEIWRHRIDGEIWDEPKIHGNVILFGGVDCKVHYLDIETGEEIWNVQTSTLQKSSWKSPYEMFSAEIKKETSFEVLEETKYKSKKGDTVSLSDYHIESEYISGSDYKSENDYNLQFMILDNNNIKLTEQLPIMNSITTTNTSEATTTTCTTTSL